MRFKKLNGREVFKRLDKYRIDWEGKSRSKFQFSVKDFLYNYWKYDICYEEMPCAGTRLSIDIVNMTRRIAVEVHGDQHVKYVKHFHRNRAQYAAQIRRDMDKLKWCNINKIQLVEIYTSTPFSEDWFKKEQNITL